MHLRGLLASPDESAKAIGDADAALQQQLHSSARRTILRVHLSIADWLYGARVRQHLLSFDRQNALSDQNLSSRGKLYLLDRVVRRPVSTLVAVPACELGACRCGRAAPESAGVRVVQILRRERASG